MEDKILSIRKSALGTIEHEFDKLNRRATKIGAPPVAFEITREWTYVVNEDPYTGAILLTPYHIPMLDIKVIGAAPKFEGWTFLGTLEHTDGGNILRSVPGQTIPEEYRNVDRKCDHCQWNRIRKDTFVVRHEDGTTKQVGRQCVRDFLGHRSPENIVRWADFMVKLGDWDGGDNEFGAGGWNIKEDPTIDMLDFLANTAAIIRNFGWVPASDDFGFPTKQRVLDHFFPPRELTWSAQQDADKEKVRATDADYDLAERAREWAKNVDATNDYLGNIKVIATNDYVGIRQFGIAASIVGVFKKNEEKRLRESTEFVNEWFGTEKERLDLTVRVLNTFERESMYGLTTIHKMVTADGHRVVWFATGYTTLEQGVTYHVKATIKGHNEWKGMKETAVNRLKVTEELDGAAADIFWKNKFAEAEKAQEEDAFMNDPDLFTFKKEQKFADEHNIRVYCTECAQWIPEDTVEFLNIEEDIQGRDKMTFNCPTCKTKNTSLRVG